MLHAIDGLTPGIWAADTLLYGVEVKFYSAELSLSPQIQPGFPASLRPGMAPASPVAWSKQPPAA